MKKSVLSVALSLVIFPLVAQHDKNCEMYPALVDSVYVYDKDNTNSLVSWKLNTIWLYQNSEGKHTRLTFINGMDRKLIRASDYYYDSNGNRDLELHFFWGDNTWNDYIRTESEFDENNRKISETRTILRQGTWTLSAYYYFEYPENDVIKIHYQVKDEEGNLFDKRVTEQVFRDKKLVETRIYDGISGSLIELNYYYYNENGKIAEFIILTPDKMTGLMKEFRRRLYYYDEFMLLRKVLFEEMKNNEWEQFSRYEYFYTLDHARKVMVCHNGHNICISVSALKAHLAHGDQLGSCKASDNNESPNKKTDETYSITNRFIIYPNPASDMVTIRFNKPLNHGFEKVELTDSYGRILKTSVVKQASEVTFYRAGLQSGNYLLRFTGRETISAAIIFE